MLLDYSDVSFLIWLKLLFKLQSNKARRSPIYLLPELSFQPSGLHAGHGPLERFSNNQVS